MVIKPVNTTTPDIRGRLAPLDGLRAFAALGVLWIHTWTLFGNPRFIINGIDVASIVALGGNGVDLFFVISGFCMYYFYASNKRFTYTDLWAFLKKRWTRLSPACYTVACVYIIVATYHDPGYLYIKSLLTSVSYSAGLFPDHSPTPILWSLTPEWQFYVIIPFLIIYQKRWGFRKTFLVISCSLLITAVAGVLFLKTGSDLLTSQLVFRYFEFMWGILVGRVLLIYPEIRLRYRYIYFFLFLLVTYGGRIMISKTILAWSSDHYNLFKLIGFTLMGLGFAGIMYLALTSKKWLKLFFGNKIISFIGKVSFSFYLWHALILMLIGKKLQVIFPAMQNSTCLAITFIICVAILIPLSTLSFNFLEKPFIGHKRIK